jgi:hypothetical protein
MLGPSAHIGVLRAAARLIDAATDHPESAIGMPVSADGSAAAFTLRSREPGPAWL